MNSTLLLLCCSFLNRAGHARKVKWLTGKPIPKRAETESHSECLSELIRCTRTISIDTTRDVSSNI